MKGTVLYPPVSFDENEWFLVISSALIWAVMIFLPKRLSVVSITVIWALNLCLAQTADFLIGKKPVQLYNYNDSERFEWSDVWLYVLSYPPAVYLFVYGLEKWKSCFHRNPWRIAFFITGAALVTTGLEAAAVHYGVFQYYTWHLYYSFVVYLGVYGLNLWVYRLMLRSLGKPAGSLLVSRRKEE